MQVAIIGGGAAGLFCAVNLKEKNPSVRVTIYESGSRALAKVAITGGGRCNLTHSFEGIDRLSMAYPRGEKLLKKVFRTWNHQQTFEWWERHGVRLVTQTDGCVFPRSQDANEIVQTLLKLAQQQGTQIRTQQRVLAIHPPTDTEGWQVETAQRTETYDAVVVTTGGSPKASGLHFLSHIPQLTFIDPVPSLFTLNIPDTGLNQLMGTVVEPATVSLCGTKWKGSGALLLTHWGISGPATLKLSSYAARWLAEHRYEAQVAINWCHHLNEQEVQQMIAHIVSVHPNKHLSSVPRPDGQATDHPCHFCRLTNRLWQHILQRSDLAPEKPWCELGKKGLHKLVNTLVNDTYTLKGQSRFKEEFVTCGGVALSNINPDTMECRAHPGLFFAGEVLDIDAITGGFNLQAAWTTGYVVAETLAQRAV